MPYNKPGVEITQVQKSMTPTLIAPELPAVILGTEYISYTDVFANQDLSITTANVTLKAASNQTVDQASIVIEIGSGIYKYTGAVTSSYNTGTQVLAITTSSIGTWDDGVTATNAVTKKNCSVTVHYRTYETACDPTIQSYDASTTTGFKVLAPIALGCSIAQSAGVASIYYVATNSGTGIDAAMTTVLDNLQTSEVYAICPLTTTSATIASVVGHAVTMSAPTEKKERIVIGSYAFPTLTASKDTDAGTLRDIATAIGNKRYVNVVPDVFYYSTPVHINMLMAAYKSLLPLVTANAPAMYLSETTGVTTVYAAGTVINDTLLSSLRVQGITVINASLPLPGPYAAAFVAGWVSNNPAEAGMTNTLVGPFNATLHGKDYFKESQLNTIAQGGNFLITSPAAGVLTVRHQLTTDMSSVEKRELNIVKAVDYVAKYLRNVLSPLIGKYNITPQFLGSFNASLSILGSTLVRDGVIKSFTILSVTQVGDTLLVDIKIEVFYPCNYIKINLIF